jgi:transposase
MKKYSFYVGIDVSKLKLDVSLVKAQGGEFVTHFTVNNTSKGIQQMFTRLQKHHGDIASMLISYEDTGVYSLPLSCHLSEQAQDYWMIPAIEIKRSKGLTRGKTDKSDSKDIAFYALTHQHKLKLSSIPTKGLLRLKLLQTEREKVMKAIRLLSSTQEGEGYIPKDVMSAVAKINNSTIKQLEKVVTKLDKEMTALVKSNELLQKQFELITSIPGVGPQTAYYIITTTKSFSTFDNARQLACYAGVAPFEYRSGTSIKGRTKVSHLADKKLKSLLNLCALNAKKHDKQLAHYYEKKLAEGKSKMLVINNIRAKLLTRIFAVINRGSPYVNTFQFAA